MAKQPEHVLDDHLALALQRIGPHVRSWKRVNGLFQRPKSAAMVRIGILGACDRYGFLSRPGRLPIPFEIEAKWGRNTLSDDQKAWKRTCEFLGIPWFLCYARAPSDFAAAAAQTAEKVHELEKTYADRG